MPADGVDYTSLTFRKVSKDLGVFNNTTNALTQPEQQIGRLVLTSDEMNADRLDVIIQDDVAGSDFSAHITIFTTTGASGGSTPEEIAEAVWEAETRQLSSPSNCLSTGTIQELKAYMRSASNNLTQKQLLALLIKLLRSA
jgi:hypothetical protein